MSAQSSLFEASCSAGPAPQCSHRTFSARPLHRARQPCRPQRVVTRHRRALSLHASTDTESSAEPTPGASSQAGSSGGPKGLDVEVNKFARSAATTFAPRASGATKNPAYKGSLLYTIFGVQAWVFLVIGGLLSFNLIFPTDEPSIARLLGMWSIWMFTIPALRARECTAPEKDALNYLFLLIPVINVALPFVWKSFPFIYSADVVALAGMYAWKVGLPAAAEDA